MKKFYRTFLLLVTVACLAVPAIGQEPHDESFHEDADPEKGPPHQHRGGPGSHRGEGPPPGHMEHHQDGEEHLDRLMGRLREADPEAFEELQRLRKEDPRGFRRELKGRRDHLRKQQFMAGLREFPELHEAFENLTPEERERFGDRLRNGMEGKRRRMEDRVDPKIHELEKELRSLARAYHDAPEEKRDAAKAEIRGALEKVFDAREVQRANQVKQAEKRLEKLKTALESRTTNREKIIERRLLDLTDGDPLAW